MNTLLLMNFVYRKENQQKLNQIHVFIEEK